MLGDDVASKHNVFFRQDLQICGLQKIWRHILWIYKQSSSIHIFCGQFHMRWKILHHHWLWQIWTVIITKRHELVNILRNIFVIITVIDGVMTKVRESLQLFQNHGDLWGRGGRGDLWAPLWAGVTKNIVIPCIKTFVDSVEAFHDPSQGLLIVTEYFRCFLDSSKRPRLSRN